MSLILFVMTGVGVVISLLALPLIMRRVPPNAWYGFRVPATFADERVWYDANASSGRELLLYGLVLIALALTLPGIPGMSEGLYGGILVAVTLAGALLLTVVGWTRANRMLRERKIQDQRGRA